ncbi:MAG: DUF1127 domain-containing protein [Rhodobacterales bacterium]|nr:DUF1127 domain-containing protein [Rhodobacterales bacterium]
MPQSRAQSRATPLSLRTGTSLIQRVINALTVASVRRRDRRALAQLDPHLLRDIGLTRDEADGEAIKPFWQP